MIAKTIFQAMQNHFAWLLFFSFTDKVSDFLRAGGVFKIGDGVKLQGERSFA